MRKTITFFVAACLVIAGSIFARTPVESQTPKPLSALRPHALVTGIQTGGAAPSGPSHQKKDTASPRIYPIAPGVWYPGDGPIPANPVRYYRIRCWPGCHHGSPYGKYPKTPLGMRPIFPTSTVPSK